MSAHRSTFSLTSALTAALIVLVASILCAHAAQDVTVKVPFDFQAGDTHFGPGTYVLSMDEAVAGSVIIQSADRTRLGNEPCQRRHLRRRGEREPRGIEGQVDLGRRQQARGS